MITDRITKYLEENKTTVNDYLSKNVEKLAGHSFQRQFMGKEDKDNNDYYKHKLRLSSAGKCPRQVAYKYHGFDKAGKEIDGRAKIIFFQGDLAELMLMNLAKLAGCPVMATGLEQISLFFPVEAGDGIHFIEGHPDGYIIDKGCLLVECKSMSSFGYRKFEKGEIDDSYRAQINVYLEASGLDSCILVAMNKDNGAIGEMRIEKDMQIVMQSHENMVSVISSGRTELPEPMFECNDKGMYPWNCLYCSYHETCKPNAEKTLVGRSYKLKEKNYGKDNSEQDTNGDKGDGSKDV